MQYALLEIDDLERMLLRAGCGNDVIAHCRVVTALAQAISLKIGGCDPDLVRTGAMLHDIGRGKTHDIRHALEGSHIAQEMGLGQDVIHIIKTHIGAGITLKEAEYFNLPRESYLPVSLESKIVAHADNLFSGTKRRSRQELTAHLKKKKLDKKIRKRVKQLHRDLSILAGCDVDDIKI